MHIRSALLIARRPVGLLDLATALHARAVRLVSTGETATALTAAGLPVRAEDDLPPHLLALGDPQRTVQLLVAELPEGTGADGLDVVVPSLVRAAARAYDRIAVIVDRADHRALLDALDRGGPDTGQRQSWAVKAARRVVEHDEQVADRLAIYETAELPAISSFVADFPDPLILDAERIQTLSHGENPHQRAALYATSTPTGEPSLADAEQIQGPSPDYGGLVDLDAALRLAVELPAAGAVLVRRGHPIGAAMALDDAEPLLDVFTRARKVDPDNVYGAVVALNRPVDGATAAQIAKRSLGGVLAPAFDAAARKALKRRSRLRALILEPWPEPGGGLELRPIAGGLLVQEADDALDAARSGRVPTRRAPEPEQWPALELAWRTAHRARSLAVVLARPGALIGVGAGQPSIADAARLAIDRARRAGHPLEGAVAACDGVIEFGETIDALAEAGIAAVVQPGGGSHDGGVIGRADRVGVALVLTGVRHLSR